MASAQGTNIKVQTTQVAYNDELTPSLFSNIPPHRPQHCGVALLLNNTFYMYSLLA